EHAVAQDAGVVHEHVELAVGLDGLVDHVLGAVPARDVVAVGHRFAASLLDGLDHFVGRTGVRAAAVDLGAEVVDDHLRAVRGQHDRVLAADAAACAGHDCNSSLTQTGHSSLPLLGFAAVGNFANLVIGAISARASTALGSWGICAAVIGAGCPAN